VVRVGKPGTQLREPPYLVLASRPDGPLHGHAIIQGADELPGGRVRRATATLPTALDRLADRRYVELVREEAAKGRVRRCYGLASRGTDALRARASRMAQAARLVTGRGCQPGAGGSARKASPA
jgi:PadR family transcriptional regulator PadR